MDMSEAREFVKETYFTKAKLHLAFLASQIVDDVEPVIERTEVLFDEMLPDMAYLDDPKNFMASAVYMCNANLALYRALREQGVDAHQFGAAMLDGLKKASFTPGPMGESEEDLQTMKRIAQESQDNPTPGKFGIEVIEDDELDMAYNITSCAICHSFSRYDAMDLVPYMCASDDVVSDKGAQGLVRSGSIALGAHQCDFRYKRGAEPQRLAHMYPDQIRWVNQAS
jgi:hypothetical protein